MMFYDLNRNVQNLIVDQALLYKMMPNGNDSQTVRHLTYFDHNYCFDSHSVAPNITTVAVNDVV